MIYELRVYTAMPGRLPDVLARFRDHTVGIWNRLGIRQLGYWTTAVGPDSNALTYMLVWESLADREVKWGKFVVDPEWVEVRKASELAGPIVAIWTARSWRQPLSHLRNSLFRADALLRLVTCALFGSSFGRCPR